jgi:hypothetical protein
VSARPAPQSPGARHSPLSFEHQTRAEVRARRWLRLHVFLVGAVTLLFCAALSHALMRLGVAHLGARFVLSLTGAYALYLGLLYLWGRWLLSRDEGSLGDVPDLGSGPGSTNSSACARPFEAGGGGDFGGGGASASFEGGAAGDAVSGTVEALGNADEGIVVVVPLALAVGAAVLLGTGLGFVVFSLFGVEVLLGVVVEIAFAPVGGALAYKARREGWLVYALRRTAWPMAGVLLCALLLGLALQRWLPAAATLPQALRMLWA